MPTPLVSSLVLTPSRRSSAHTPGMPLGSLGDGSNTATADEAHQGAGAQGREELSAQCPPGVPEGLDAGRNGLGDPEGGSESPAGVGRKQGPSPAPTPFENPHTHSVYFGLPLMPGLNSREHPMRRSRRVKREHHVVAWALQAARIPHDLAPCTVRFTRHGTRRMDDDNLIGAFKAVRDEVAHWLGVNDGGTAVAWDYAPQRIGPGPATVTIDFIAQKHTG